MGFLSRIFGKSKEDKQEPPRQTYEEWERERFQEYFEFNKTTGEIMKDIANNHFNGMTLINGKHPCEIINEKPENKHDISLMLACCKAELESLDITGAMPAAHYFERAAIIFARQKDYDNEIKICELYLDAVKSNGSQGPESIRKRIPKAIAKKEKAERKKIKP